MLVAGSVSPRTQSRLDPTLRKQHHRPCRQPATQQSAPEGIAKATSSLASITGNTVDQNGLFFISKARSAHEELEGNRRVNGTVSSRGRDSPFHGYFPKLTETAIVKDTADRSASIPFRNTSANDRSFRPKTSPILHVNSRTETKPISRLGSPVNKVISKTDSRLRSSSSSESITLPPSRPPTPVTASDDRRRRPYSRTTLPSPDGSQVSRQRRSYTPRSSATASRPRSVASSSRYTDYDMDNQETVSEEYLHVKPVDVVSIVDTEESHRLLRQQHISSAMLYRQHSRGPRSIPGEYLAEHSHPMDSGRRSHPAMKFNERPCIRSESFFNEDLCDCINDLSRECCDVLGPRHCYDCEKLYRRVDASSRNLESFPMSMGPEQLAIMNVVGRMYPELSPLEVFHRIEQGDISVPSLRRDTRVHDRVRTAISDNGPPALLRKSSISAFNIPDGIGFFANIADLRTQLLQKQGGRAGRKNLFDELFKDQAHLPAVEEVLLVPKDQVDWENPANYFSPPLLSRAEIQRQLNQPRFYAGEKSNSYILPVAPDVDTLAGRNADAVKKIQNELASYKEARDGDEDIWATKHRIHSAMSGRSATSTLDTEAVCTAAFDQMSMRSDTGTLDDVDDDDDDDGASQKDYRDDDTDEEMKTE
ncbi:uncharacterized protein [Amphiura filiformis]|uniref:uncharacterized protein n=1 Tax=Amphiura filiformis TaxID=82378 RepID=UPI003B20E6A6